MRASFVDLRKKSNQVIRALRRNESVTLFYRGREAAIIRPLGARDTGVIRMAAGDHPAFGLWADRADLKDVAGHVRKLRKGRIDGL